MLKVLASEDCYWYENAKGMVHRWRMVGDVVPWLLFSGPVFLSVAGIILMAALTDNNSSAIYFGMAALFGSIFWAICGWRYCCREQFFSMLQHSRQLADTHGFGDDAVTHAWLSPLPGILCWDEATQRFFVRSSTTNYQPWVFCVSDISSAATFAPAIEMPKKKRWLSQPKPPSIYTLDRSAGATEQKGVLRPLDHSSYQWLRLTISNEGSKQQIDIPFDLPDPTCTYFQNLLEDALGGLGVLKHRGFPYASELLDDD